MSVRIQEHDFDVSSELAALRAGDTRVGAVATFVGVLLGISGTLLLTFLVTFLLTVMLIGYVSLGSMLGAIAVAVATASGAAHVEPRAPLLIFALAAVLLVLYTHRGNLARMRAGTESRARRLWLLRPRHPA